MGAHPPPGARSGRAALVLGYPRPSRPVPGKVTGNAGCGRKRQHSHSSGRPRCPRASYLRVCPLLAHPFSPSSIAPSLSRIRFRSDQAHGGKCRGGSRDSAGGTRCFRRPKCLAKPLPSRCHAWLFQRLFTRGKSKSALLEPPLSVRPRGITWGVCLFLFFLSCICDMCMYLYICTHAHKYIYDVDHMYDM